MVKNGSPKIIVVFVCLRCVGHEKKLCGDNFCERTLFDKVRSPDAFWDAPGLRFDVIWGSKMGLFWRKKRAAENQRFLSFCDNIFPKKTQKRKTRKVLKVS